MLLTTKSSLWPLFNLLELHLFICIYTHACFGESSLHTRYVLGIELRLPGLVASTFAFWAISTAHVIQMLSPFPGCFSLLHSQLLYKPPVPVVVEPPRMNPSPAPEQLAQTPQSGGRETCVFRWDWQGSANTENCVIQEICQREKRSVALECWVSFPEHQKRKCFAIQIPARIITSEEMSQSASRC